MEIFLGFEGCCLSLLFGLVRLRRPIAGALFLAAVAIFICNESVKPELTTTLIAAPPDRIDPALEGKQIAVRATLSTDAQLEDPDYLLPGNYVSLQRIVETYASVP